jgi:predicted nucleotidyltransferase
MTLAELPIEIDREEIATFCEERGISRLAFFGSVLRDDFTEASDLDLLVEYLPGRHPGLMLFRHQDELRTWFDRIVDLHTAASLSGYFRDKVIAESLPVYERA